MSQVYRYLMTAERRSQLVHGPALELVCLRRYSSFFPFIPRPSAFRVLGGGYLVRVHSGEGDDKKPRQAFGIAIDPGADFIENLYRCGFSLSDIDMVLVSHDHVDHMAALDPLLSLLGYRMLLGDRRFSRDRRLVILGNDSVAERYGFFNRPDRKDAVFVAHLNDWSALLTRTDLKLPPPDVDLRLQRIQGLNHLDMAAHESCGFRIGMGDDGPSVGFTGDTGTFAFRDQEPVELRTQDRAPLARQWRPVLDADVMIAHISSVPLPQLRQLANLPVDPSTRLAQAYDRLSLAAKKQVEFAFRIQEANDLIGSAPRHYQPSRRHLYLAGVLAFAEAYHARPNRRRRRLMLLGELREELATFRTKVALSLNDHVFQNRARPRAPRALTSDIGLTVVIDVKGARILCSTCAVDNDLTADEQLHWPHEIREVCVKGEDEGIFYNCSVHDPSQQSDQMFVERMESYSLFGRPTIR